MSKKGAKEQARTQKTLQMLTEDPAQCPWRMKPCLSTLLMERAQREADIVVDCTACKRKFFVTSYDHISHIKFVARRAESLDEFVNAKRATT